MSWQIYGKIAEKIVAEELCNDFFCYGDEENARSLFEKYRKCTEIYCTLWQSGLKLEQLAVAV